MHVCVVHHGVHSGQMSAHALTTRARDRARVGMDCTISIETSKHQNGGRFKFHGMC